MIRIHTVTVSHFEQNARIIFHENEQVAVMVDPGYDAEVLLRAAEPDTHRISGIFLTHCHIDHGGGVKRLLALLEKEGLPKPPVYYHSHEQFLANTIEPYGMSLGFPRGLYENVPRADYHLDGMETFFIGSVAARLLFTPGHSPGHVAMYFGETPVTLTGDFSSGETVSSVVIAGDALFQGSIGRTDLPGGDFQTLLTSIRNALFSLPDNTMVLSGHGPNTTIGVEKRVNPFLK